MRLDDRCRRPATPSTSNQSASSAASGGVEADGGLHRALRRRRSARVSVTVARVPSPGADRQRPGDARPPATAPRRARRGPARGAGALGVHRGADPAAEHAAGDRGDERRRSSASGSSAAATGSGIQTCDQPHSAASADRADATPATRAEARAAGRAPTRSATSSTSDRLDDVEREVRGRLPEDRADEQREQRRACTRKNATARRARRRGRAACARRRAPTPAASAIRSGWKTSGTAGRRSRTRPGRSTGRRAAPPAEQARVRRRCSGADRVGRAPALARAGGRPRRAARARRRSSATAPPMQHQVRRAPERHVLAEEAMPDVVEREADAARSAAHDGASARRRAGAYQPWRDAHARRGRPGRSSGSAMASTAGERDAEEADEDEVVGGVGERARVAAVVDVQRDVPVHPEHGDAAASTPTTAERQRGPARQPGDALAEAASRRDPADAAAAMADGRARASSTVTRVDRRRRDRDLVERRPAGRRGGRVQRAMDMNP